MTCHWNLHDRCYYWSRYYRLFGASEFCPAFYGIRFAALKCSVWFNISFLLLIIALFIPLRFMASHYLPLWYFHFFHIVIIFYFNYFYFRYFNLLRIVKIFEKRNIVVNRLSTSLNTEFHAHRMKRQSDVAF